MTRKWLTRNPDETRTINYKRQENDKQEIQMKQERINLQKNKENAKTMIVATIEKTCKK